MRIIYFIFWSSCFPARKYYETSIYIFRIMRVLMSDTRLYRTPNDTKFFYYIKLCHIFKLSISCPVFVSVSMYHSIEMMFWAKKKIEMMLWFVILIAVNCLEWLQRVIIGWRVETSEGTLFVWANMMSWRYSLFYIWAEPIYRIVLLCFWRNLLCLSYYVLV
jgi:hypothetical protein